MSETFISHNDKNKKSFIKFRINLLIFPSPYELELVKLEMNFMYRKAYCMRKSKIGQRTSLSRNLFN